MFGSKKIQLISVTLVFVLLSSFTVSNRLMKKMLKEIETTFHTKEVKLISLELHNQQLTIHEKDQFFKIEKNKQLLGYAYLGKAASKTDEFDYLILIDTDLIIKKTKILIYREDYGGEIGSKRWLRQFTGKSINDKLLYEKDIIAISGATISATSMTNAVNTFLKNISLLRKNKFL